MSGGNRDWVRPGTYCWPLWGVGGLMDWELTNRGHMLQQVWHDGDPCLFSKTISAEHGFQIILQGTSLNELVTYSCTYKLSWILYARVIYVIFILWMSFTCKLLNSFCRCTIILVFFKLSACRIFSHFIYQDFQSHVIKFIHIISDHTWSVNEPVFFLHLDIP